MSGRSRIAPGSATDRALKTLRDEYPEMLPQVEELMRKWGVCTLNVEDEFEWILDRASRHNGVAYTMPNEYRSTLRAIHRRAANALHELRYGSPIT